MAGSSGSTSTRCNGPSGASLSSAAPSIAVDDVRGFTTASVNGAQLPVSASNPLTVTVGANAYTLVGASIDPISTSTTPNGMSGTLTFSGNVLVSDGAAGNTVMAANASVIIRPSARGNTSQLAATDRPVAGQIRFSARAVRSASVRAGRCASLVPFARSGATRSPAPMRQRAQERLSA